jgi:hypothetical protein
MVREERKYFIVPTEKYVPEEKYLDYLSTYPGYLRNNVIANTSEKIFPFINKNNLWFTTFLLLSTTIIVLTIDLNFNINPNKVILFTIPLLFYLFITFIPKKINSIIGTNPEVESDISVLENNIDNLESELSYLDERISDLED